MTDALIISVTSIINILLGVFILFRNPKAILNRIFASLSLSFVIWSVFNFLADNASSNNLLFTRLTFASAVFIALFIYELSNLFPTEKSLNSKRVRVFIWCFAMISFLLSLTPLIAKDINKLTNGVEVEIGILYGFYSLYIFSLITIVAVNFLKRYKSGSVQIKNQVRIMLFGILTYAIFAIASNLVLPILIDSWSSSRYGPISTLLFVGFLAYAIVRHRLLDIRMVVARSIAYILVFATLVSLYSFLVFFLTERLIGKDSVIYQRYIPVLTAIFLAFTTQYIRKYFDSISNRYFYRDAYDPQVFLDNLNKALVSNVDLEALLSHCTEIINENLKPAFCIFGLKETAYSPQRIIRDIKSKFSQEDIDIARSVTPHMHKTVIVTDELIEDLDLQQRLRKYDIALISRLTTDVTLESEGLGYVAFGPKKSGNPYTKQDLKIIEIITNELVIAIQNALRFEEIEKFNITLQEKVEDATKKLKHTNEKLKALDETKDEFISMASHQLRTPLTSVKGYLSMVLEGDAGDVSPMQRKLLDQAFVSSQRMVYLIADLLNVSRLRTGKFVLEPIESNLADVVEGEIGQLKETAAGRGLELTYDKPENFPVLFLDETKLRQVVMNFTDNAIYYTPSGGHIKVKLEDKGESIECTVSDDGMGVPKNEQPHLFTKFFRANNAKKARPDGTGLGLFMAKKVIVAQGGSIIFSSHEGKGSTFGFALPKAKLKAPAATEKES